MTETLHDSCRELDQMLSQISEGCRNLVDGLHKCESYVNSYAVSQLCCTLSLVGLLVAAAVSSLVCAHRGEGYVYILLRLNEGISVLWLDQAELVADRASWRGYGYEVLSFFEFVDMINTMVRKLDYSNWAKALDWLNSCGRYPLRKYDKSPLGFWMLT